jgi:hypothetical protein
MGLGREFVLYLLRTSALLGTPSFQSIHDYYPFAMEDGGRLAPMAIELVDRLAIFVAVRRFHGMGAADSRSLRYDSYVRMHRFVRRFASIPSRRFSGDVRREFMQRLFAALHGTLGSYLRDALSLFRKAVPTLCWHAFMFLGLRFFPSFLLFAWWPPLLFLVRKVLRSYTFCASLRWV